MLAPGQSRFSLSHAAVEGTVQVRISDVVGHERITDLVEVCPDCDARFDAEQNVVILAERALPRQEVRIAYAVREALQR